MIEYIGGALVLIGAWIAARPLLLRIIIRMALKYGFKKLLDYLYKSAREFPEDSQERDCYKEIIQAVFALTQLIGNALKINITPKQLKPGYKSPKEKKVLRQQKRLINKYNKNRKRRNR